MREKEGEGKSVKQNLKAINLYFLDLNIEDDDNLQNDAEEVPPSKKRKIIESNVEQSKESYFQLKTSKGQLKQTKLQVLASVAELELHSTKNPVDIEGVSESSLQIVGDTLNVCKAINYGLLY